MAIEDYSVEYLESLFDYNPDTGVITRKAVDESYGRSWKSYNTSFAGSVVPPTLVRIRGDRISTARLAYKLAFKKDPVNKIYFRDSDSTNHKLDNFKARSKKVSMLTNFNTIDVNCSKYISYNQKTGVLIWLPRGDNSFDTRYANTPAGYLSSAGYIDIHSNIIGNVKAHRLAWYLYYNVDPGAYLIDHIDMNKTNNNILNLRLADRSINGINNSVNTLGYYKSRDKFRVHVYAAGAYSSLGTFDTEQAARTAYETAVSQYRLEYTPTKQEQEILDELYNTYPNCSKQLQHAAHDIQIKSLKFKQSLAQQLIKNPP